VNALAKPEVGEYFAANFVSAFQKVGNFRIQNGQKQGGNVASYFCTPQGQVLDIIPGPVDAATLMREARWVEETWKLGQLQHRSESGMRSLFASAHAKRLEEDVTVPPQLKGRLTAPIAYQLAMREYNGLSPDGKAHALLAREPMAPISRVYEYVFEKILNQKVSTDPVHLRNGG